MRAGKITFVKAQRDRNDKKKLLKIRRERKKRLK